MSLVRFQARTFDISSKESLKPSVAGTDSRWYGSLAGLACSCSESPPKRHNAMQSPNTGGKLLPMG